MARKGIYFGQLTEDVMNSGASYRVDLSYGKFTLSPQKLPNGATYYYALKRSRGKLYKAYVGRRGAVTRDDVHKATMKVAHAILRDTGYYGRDNLGYERR